MNKTKIHKEKKSENDSAFKSQTLYEVIEETKRKFENSEYSQKIFFGCIEKNKKLQIKAYGHNKELAEIYESGFSSPLKGIYHFFNLLGTKTVDKDSLINAVFEWAYSYNYSKIRLKLISWFDQEAKITAEFRLNSENDKNLFKRLEERVGRIHEDRESIELV